MTPTEELALSYVRKHKPSGPVALGELMGIKSNHASNLLKSLLEQGKVKKTKPRWTVK